MARSSSAMIADISKRPFCKSLACLMLALRLLTVVVDAGHDLDGVVGQQGEVFEPWSFGEHLVRPDSNGSGDSTGANTANWFLDSKLFGMKASKFPSSG